MQVDPPPPDPEIADDSVAEGVLPAAEPASQPTAPRGWWSRGLLGLLVVLTGGLAVHAAAGADRSLR